MADEVRDETAGEAAAETQDAESGAKAQGDGDDGAKADAEKTE